MANLVQIKKNRWEKFPQIKHFSTGEKYFWIKELKRHKSGPTLADFSEYTVYSYIYKQNNLS